MCPIGEHRPLADGPKAPPAAPDRPLGESRSWLEAARDRLDRADAAAVEWSRAPTTAFGRLLALVAGVSAVGIPLGILLFDDPPIVFREGAPGTWLSFAMLLATAVVARAVHRRTVAPGARWHSTFWGLSAGVFTVLAIVEIAQPTVFLSHWLRDNLDMGAPLGFADLDAALVVGLLLTIAVTLLVRARVLLRHPWTVALFAGGMVLAVASQALDSALPATEWEFVAEEILKLGAEPFFVVGFLLALRATATSADRRE